MSVGNNVAAYVFCLCEVREIYFKRTQKTKPKHDMGWASGTPSEHHTTTPPSSRIPRSAVVRAIVKRTLAA